jgi:hypothetical protein
MGATAMTVWNDEMTTAAIGMRRAGVPGKVIASRLGVSPKALKSKMFSKGVHCTLTRKRGHNKSLQARGRLISYDCVDIEDILP